VTDTPASSPPPPGAIPVEKLHQGLRGHIQKDEHVLWQGRGSGRALGALNRALLIRLGLLAIGVTLLIILMLQGDRPGFNWVAWVLGGVLLIRVLWFFWQSSSTPSRQAAMLTTNRVVSVDMVRPMATWFILKGGSGRADGQMFDPHPIVVTGTKARGHIRLNTGSQKLHAYPPFILFNAEKPLELAEKIRKTLAITAPIEDRTK
jgi:hypothetical protein